MSLTAAVIENIVKAKCSECIRCRLFSWKHEVNCNGMQFPLFCMLPFPGIYRINVRLQMQLCSLMCKLILYFKRVLICKRV